jgi:hypothetical protein
MRQNTKKMFCSDPISSKKHSSFEKQRKKAGKSAPDKRITKLPQQNSTSENCRQIDRFASQVVFSFKLESLKKEFANKYKNAATRIVQEHEDLYEKEHRCNSRAL